MKVSKSSNNITNYGSLEVTPVDWDETLENSSKKSNPSLGNELDNRFIRTNHDTIKFAQKLREVLDPNIKDRRWRDMKVYKMCFTHSQAVECTIEQLDEGKPSNNLNSEQRAVKLLNELVYAGYIFHVANRHRFSVGQSKTLYFRFDDNLLASDIKQIENGHGIHFHHEILQQNEDLKLTVDRMSQELSSVNQLLMETNGRLAFMEPKVASSQDAVQSIILFGYLFAIAYTIHFYEQIGQISVLMALLIIFATYLIVGTTSKSEINGRNKNFLLAHINVISNFVRSGQNYSKIENSEECQSEYNDSLEGRSIGSLTPILINEVNDLHSGSSIYSTLSTIKMRDFHEIPEPELWTYNPILVCANTAASPDLKVDSSPSGICPIGAPFKFSSDLFEGTCLIRLKDVKSENYEGDEKYFKGRGRKFQVVVQGRFKEPLKVSDVLTGHEFVRPIKNLPPRWILKAASRLIKSLSPGAELDVTSDKPKQLANFAATSQAMSAECPGNEPDIELSDFPEDLSIFGGYFKDRKVSARKRKSYFASPTRAGKHSYDTESIYTFDFYQHLLDMKTYSLDIGFTKINLAKRLNGQPIQIMCKTTKGRYLWSFQLWHEDLLPKTKD